jgi:hypothetical protein
MINDINILKPSHQPLSNSHMSWGTDCDFNVVRSYNTFIDPKQNLQNTRETFM